MNLVDKFVELSEWSTARKIAVVALGYMLPTQLVQYVAARMVVDNEAVTSFIDIGWLDGIFAVLIPASILIGLAARVEVRAGRQGEWTFYLLFTIYTLAVGLAATYALGNGNALPVYSALAPLLIMPMLFDAMKSIYVLSLGGVSLLATAFATSFGLDYAPAIIDRSIDAYQAPAIQFGQLAILAPIVIAEGAIMIIVGVALRRDRAQLAETSRRLDTAVGLISKYVPAELASGILSGTEAPSSGYRRQKVTAFFSDIVGFTELAEELEPEDLALVLNEYFTEMAAIAERNLGTVDELQGDGLILVFGAPTFRSDRAHALDAVHAATEMQAAVTRLNEHWREVGIDVGIRVRVGINTGVVTVGHFGSGNRLKYTVLGKHVNLAARVQSMCEPGKVLVSHATWLLVKDDVGARSLGEREFKGITRPVEVHELV